jgi:hypothetical protein
MLLKKQVKTLPLPLPKNLADEQALTADASVAVASEEAFEAIEQDELPSSIDEMEVVEESEEA